MAYKVQKPCRVCGKMYTPCPDCENDKSIFHWRTVACSYECGKIYFERVMETRSTDVAKTKSDNPTVVDNDMTETVLNNELQDDVVETKSTRRKKTVEIKKVAEDVCD